MAGEGADVRSYTVRLELADEPGTLLAALEPVAEHGGNLLGVHHERGSLTPRGRVPVEVDLACPAGRFAELVEALRGAGVTVTRAGERRYTDEVTVLLVGHVVDSDLSETLTRIQSCAAADVTDAALSAPEGTADASTLRLVLATTDEQDRVLETVREVAAEKDLRLVEPVGVGGAP